MKKILTILFMLVTSVVFSQATLTDLNLVFDISESNSYSSPFLVKGTVMHSTSEYNGNQILVGDLVYFQDGPATYSLPISTIVSQSYSYVELQLLDISGTIPYIPTGRAALIRTSNPDLLPVPPDGIPSDLSTGILNDLRLKIQNGVTLAEEITDYVGSAGVIPAVSASSHTGEWWRNSSGEGYRSNGTIWLPVGGSAYDTLYVDTGLLIIKGPNDSLSTDVISIAPVQSLNAGTGISITPYPGGAYTINSTVVSRIDTFQVNGANLLLSLQGDGQPAKSVAASSILSAAGGISGTGTQDYVPKWTTSSTLGNSSIREVSGYVGIGGSPTTARLKIVDNGQLGSYVFESHADDSSPWAAGFFNDTYSTTVPAFSYFARNDGNWEEGVSAGKTYSLYQGYGNNRLILFASGDFYIQNNLGLGVTPAAKLHVKGIDNLTTGFALKVQGATDNNALVVRNDGNIGLGTSGPSAKFHSSGSGEQYWKLETTSTGYSGILFKNGTQVENRLYFNANAGTTGCFVLGHLGGGGGSNKTLAVTGGMSIGSSYAGTSIPQPNSLIVQGNVGFGTIDPQRKVHISGGNPLQIDVAGYSSNILIQSTTPTVGGGLGIAFKDASDGITKHLYYRYGTFMFGSSGGGYNTDGNKSAHFHGGVSIGSGLTSEYNTNGLISEGSVSIGSALTPSKLFIKGTGVTSSTSSLIITNSNGNPLVYNLKIDDNGAIGFGQYPNTLNSAGTPVNILSTSSTGVLESHTASELVSAGGGLTGNGASTRVPVYNSSNTFTSYPGFIFPGETQGLVVGGIQFNGYGTNVGWTGSGFASEGSNRTMRFLAGSNTNASDLYGAYYYFGTLTNRPNASWIGHEFTGQLQSNNSAALTTFTSMRNNPIVQHSLTTLIGYDYNPQGGDAGITNHYAALFRFGKVGIGANTPSAKLHVVGTGNNSTTWTAQFHNNATNNALMIRDDGTVSVGTASPSSVAKFHVELDDTKTNFVINKAGSTVFSVRNDANVSFGSNAGSFAITTGTLSSSLTGQYFRFSPPSTAATSDNSGLGQIFVFGRPSSLSSGNTTYFSVTSDGAFNPSSGNRTMTGLRVHPSINQTGTATGTIYGIDYDPGITSITGAHYGLLIRAGLSGFGTPTPAQTVHIQGTARITGSDGVATTIMGRDANGDISNLGLGTGLSIATGTLNVADQSATNEIQTLSLVGSTLSLSSGGGSVTLPSGTGTTNLAVSGTVSPLTLTSDTGTDVTFTAGTNVSLVGTSGNITITATEVDGSITNEIQNLSLTGQTLAISGGTSATLPVVGLTAGTAIVVTPTAGNFTITNTGDTNAADDLLTSTIFDGDIDGTWDALTLKTNVVGEDNIIDGSITAFKLAAGAATSGQVLTYGGALVGWVPSSAVGDVAGPITNLQIGANTVGTTELLNGAVTMAKINQASATTGQVITWNGTAWIPTTPTTGSTYTAGTGISIVSNVITNTGDTNAADDLTTSTSFSGDVTGLYNNLQIAANAVGTTELADNSVSANKIGAAQVTMSKINQSAATSGQIISWDGTAWTPSNIGYSGTSDVLGTAATLTVSKIQGRGVATTAPTTGQVLAWSGSLWAPASPGLTNLNGQNGTSQTFFASSTGSDFAITSSGNVHTFALPTANATQTGKLTSSDWTTFSNKIGGSGTTDQLAIFTGSGTISSSSALSYASSTLTVAGDISPTGKLKAGTLGTTPTVMVGRNASNELSTVVVGAGLDFTGGTLSASNFYTADGTLTGSRTVTTGNLNIAFDASTSVTNNANPIRVKGISTSGNTYYPLIFQNESNADKLSFKVGASEVSMLTTTENLKLGTGSQQWILNNVGSITMPALASNPTTANSSMWINSTTNRLMVKTPDGNFKSIATLQDDLSGGNLQFSTSQSIGNTNFGNEITNTLTADITITLDGTLTEGREYKVFNSNDGATWDTFWTVASGYTVKLKDVGNVTSADGLLTMNPYRLFIITRYGNTIYVSY